MLKSFALIAAVSLSTTPVLALEEAPKTMQFVHEGVDYDYKVQENADGSRTLKGTANGGRDSFVLHVKGKRVSGTMNGQPVSFSTKSLVKITPATVQIASD